jgi:hypothetical protein
MSCGHVDLRLPGILVIAHLYIQEQIKPFINNKLWHLDRNQEQEPDSRSHALEVWRRSASCQLAVTETGGGGGMQNHRGMFRRQRRKARPGGFRPAAVLAALICLVGAGAAATQPEPTSPQAEETREEIAPGLHLVHLPGTYWDLYPTSEGVAIEAIERLKKRVGVQLKVRSDMDGLSHFVYSLNGGPSTRNKKGKIDIPIPDLHLPGIRSASAVIKAVSKDGSESRPYSILLSYYPKSYYAAYGRTEKSHITVQITDMSVGGIPIRNVVLQEPTKDERTYARRKWADVLGPDIPDYEAAARLARSIIADLEPHRGVPSDAMNNLMPFEQYERVMAGKDEVFCRNIAAIFSYACNALGIPCRTIGMMKPEPNQAMAPHSEYDLSFAASHVTTEIFSKQLNQWVWIDPFLRVVGAQLGNEGLVDTVEFQMLLNNPNRVRNLRVTVYDPKTDSLQTSPVSQIDLYRDLVNYYRKDQRFFYYSRTSARPHS